MSQLDPQIKEQFLSLPKAVQDIITDSGWQFTIRDIIKKFNLRVDQGGVIEQETMFVMFGFEDADTFLENIQREAQLDKKTALALEEEVARVIFAPLRKALIQKTDEMDAAESVIAPAPAAKTPALETREDLLKQIEDPSEIPATMPVVNPVAETRTTAASAPVAPTAPKPAAPIAPSMPTQAARAASTSKTDPYREPIE